MRLSGHRLGAHADIAPARLATAKYDKRKICPNNQSSIAAIRQNQAFRFSPANLAWPGRKPAAPKKMACQNQIKTRKQIKARLRQSGKKTILPALASPFQIALGWGRLKKEESQGFHAPYHSGY